jgi:hypothetical protein
MKNVCKSKLKKKLANSLLEKLVLLLSVWYAVACHSITVTNYRFTWCTVVINVMFNTVKPLSIISKRTAEINNECGEVTYFKLFEENCMKIITTGQISFSNYELLRFFK